jgi:hypothetical protein
LEWRLLLKRRKRYCPLTLLSQGYWVGITIDSETGKMIGGTEPALDGCAAGY